MVVVFPWTRNFQLIFRTDANHHFSRFTSSKASHAWLLCDQSFGRVESVGAEILSVSTWSKTGTCVLFDWDHSLRNYAIENWSNLELRLTSKLALLL
jgi:hypothetical protein